MMKSPLWLALSVGIGGCAPAEGHSYAGEATIVRAAVTRPSDGASLYGDCWVKGVGDQPARPVKFRAASGDTVTEKVESTFVTKVSIDDKPSLHSLMPASYWCGPEDNYSAALENSAIGRCIRESGANSPAHVVTASVEWDPASDPDSSTRSALSYTLTLQVQRPGVLMVELDPACLGFTPPPPWAELEILP
jgi:hypothetical protein